MGCLQDLENQFMSEKHQEGSRTPAGIYLMHIRHHKSFIRKHQWVDR